MKIALVGPTYPFRGGISHYTTLLYSHLQKKHDVQFYTFTRPYPKLLYPGDASSDDSRIKWVTKDAVAIVDWANPFSWIKTGSLIINWSPYIVIFPWWMWGWAIPFWIIAKMATLRKKTKALFICHNVVEHETASWKRHLTKFVLSSGDFYIVHSRGDCENLRKIIPDAKVAVSFHPTYEIFNLIAESKDNAKKKLNIDGKFKKVILFFGIVRPYKGLGYLIEAMPKIISEMPDVCLIIAGEFWESEEKYMKQIEDLKIGDTVKVINQYIPNEDVGIYFSAADVVLLPYISGTGSGIVQIAFGLNKPVIATKVGCLPEVVAHGKTGYLIEKMNAQAIADSVIAFYRNRKEVSFTRNISQGKDRFAWSRMVQTIESFLEH